MVQTKGQIVENSNLLFRLHHQRFYPKEVNKIAARWPAKAVAQFSTPK